MSAASVEASTVSTQETGPGASSRAALHALHVSTIPYSAAREMLVRRHYPRSIPGGTKLCFGPFNAHSLVRVRQSLGEAHLTREWLSDELPANSESRVLGVALRALRKNTHVKFLLSYADPSQGHLGMIYQATGWLYTGLSEATPLYDLGDGVIHHSRFLAHALGTHSARYLVGQVVAWSLVPQAGKHRYVVFLSGNQRLRALREARVKNVPCVAVNLDAAHARILAQVLNRIQGEDDLGLKADLLREVLKKLPESQVLSVLPDSATGLRGLAAMGQESIADHLQKWQQAQPARLRHLQFQVTADQLRLIEQALSKIMLAARQHRGDSPNLRGTALYLLCQRYVEKEEDNGSQGEPGSNYRQ